MTALGVLNFCVFQWLFMRRMRIVEIETGEEIGRGWIVGVLPLTGWICRYIYLPGAAP